MVGARSPFRTRESVRARGLPSVVLIHMTAFLLVLGQAAAHAEQGNAELSIEIHPASPRVGDEVGFFLHFDDPDPLGTVVYREIQYGDGAEEWIDSVPAACTSALGWTFEEAVDLVPGEIRQAAGLYHFTHVYENAGTYDVHAVAQAVRSVCPIISETDEAEADVILVVQPAA